MVNATATTDPLLNRTLGEFTLRTKIGEGGFGSVYRAEQPALNRAAVVKVLQRSHRSRLDLVQRFLREAQLASRLDHPYAAHIYAFGAEPDGVLWIAMELVRGIPLNNLLRLQGAMPLGRFAPLLERICEVVHAAHEQGIVHRDLKPANVMVMSRAGRLLPKLLDFGIAKRVLLTEDNAGDENRMAQRAVAASAAGSAEEHATPVAIDLTGSAQVTAAERSPVKHTPPAPSTRDLTATGEAMGSPPYMAPEQWDDDGQVDARTDIYSLGVLAYQCLTRRLPFWEESTRAIALAHSTKPMPPMGGAFPPEVEAVLRKALAKSKEDRYQTAIAFGEALRQAAGLTSERSTIPELAEETRQTAMQEAPQPLAEAVGALAAAHNAHQARDAMWLVLHVAIRLLGLLSLSCRTRVGSGEATDSELVGELLRQLRRRGLDDVEWVSLVRELCRPFAKRRDVYPVPELVALFYDDEGQERTVDAFAALFGLRDEAITSGSEAQIQVLLERSLPAVAKLLDALLFLSSYQLVVPRGGRAERWMGVRLPRRSTMLCTGDLQDGHPLLVDADGAVVLSLYPLLQIAQPTPGAPEELFLLEGQGRHGSGAARLVALPAGFERQEEAFWELSRSLMIAADEKGASPLDERAPYRGLSTFRPEDAAVFFGREREAESLVNRLRIQGLVAVVGPSGAGKSSFVQAGVIPNLPVGWKTLTVRPGSQPMAALRARLAKDAIVLPSGDAATMADAVRKRASESVGDDRALLLVIDQFEELFTLCGDADERQRYAELVAQLGRSSDDPLRVVVTLRDDFLIRADEMVALRERLALGLQLVTTPAAEDLLRIVIEPARRSGYAFDDAKLPWEMVQAVVGQPGALPLLSFTASKLWELRDRTVRMLPKKAYEAMGGVGGALAQHAEQTLETMSPAEQKLVHEAFRRLVTAEGTRAVVSRGELTEVLGDPVRGEAMLEKLINARLLTASEGVAATLATADVEATPGSSDQIEVVHEALLGAWPRLVRWRSEDAEGARLRDQLRQAAQQWSARGRPRGLLWRDEALAEYQLWQQRFPGRSTALEEEFGQASTALAIAGRRIRRGLLLVAFAALSLFIVFLLRANRRVSEQRAVATQKAHEAKDALAQSNEEQGRQYLLQDKPLEALAYLQAAFEEGRQGPGIRFMLGRILRLLDAQKFVIQEDPAHALSFDVSGDGKRLATASFGDHVDLFDSASGQLKGRISMPGAQAITPTFAPDGTRLLVLSSADVSVWRIADGKRQMTSAAVRNAKTAVWMADGRAILVQGDDGAMLDAQSGRVMERWPGTPVSAHDLWSGPHWLAAQKGNQLTIRIPSGVRWQVGPVAAVGLVGVQPASGRIATADPTGVQLWQGNRAAGRLATSTQALVEVLEFAPDRRPLLVVVTEQGGATLFDTNRGLPVFELARTGALQALFTPDGAKLILGYADGRLRQFDLKRLESSGWYYGRHEKMRNLAVVPGGVVGASADGSIAYWPLAPAEPLFNEKLPAGVMAFTAEVDAAGSTVSAISSSAQLLRWRLPDAQLEEHKVLSATLSTLDSADFTQNGKYIAASEAGRVHLFNRSSGLEEATWVADDKPLVFQQVVPDANRAITTRSDGKLDVWNVASKTPILAMTGLFGMLDHGGRRLLSAGMASGEIWDVDSGKRLVGYPGGRRLTFGVFSPDDRLVLFAGPESAAHIWRTDRPVLASSLEGHSIDVCFGGFLDNDLAVTGTLDGLIRVWEIATGKLISTLSVHRSSINWGTARAPYLATADSEGRVVAWELPMFTAGTAELVAAVANRGVFQIKNGALAQLRK